jgi:hypothetical protein
MAPVGTRAATGELLVGTPQGLRWWHPGTGKQRPGPGMRVRGEQANIIAVSPDGVWLALALGRFGERIFRVDLRRARAEPEAVHTLVEGETLGALAIRDDGHVILQAQTWRGELFSLRL